MYILHFRSMRDKPYKRWTVFTGPLDKPVQFPSLGSVAAFVSGLDGFLFRRKRIR